MARGLGWLKVGARDDEGGEVAVLEMRPESHERAGMTRWSVMGRGKGGEEVVVSASAYEEPFETDGEDDLREAFGAAAADEAAEVMSDFEWHVERLAGEKWADLPSGGEMLWAAWETFAPRSEAADPWAVSLALAVRELPGALEARASFSDDAGAVGALAACYLRLYADLDPEELGYGGFDPEPRTLAMGAAMHAIADIDLAGEEFAERARFEGAREFQEGGGWHA